MAPLARGAWRSCVPARGAPARSTVHPSHAPQIAALSNAAGVGGGAIFVPLFAVLLGFSVKLSTALSQAVITGGALGACLPQAPLRTAKLLAPTSAPSCLEPLLFPRHV